MKKNVTYILLLVLMACSPKENKTSTDERPNIILIMTDDMGYSDIGCFGSEINTPTLDKLANEGLRMTQFYNASRCCPTRASLLTGLYQHQAGIGDMVSDYRLPGYRGFLNQNCMTMAEVLKINGYNTYMSGKWHVGETKDKWPGKRGFDKYFGLINGASNYFSLDPYRINGPAKTMALNDDEYLPPDTGFYMTDAFTEYAVKWLDEQKTKTKPFFLYLAYTAPHWPLHALPEDIAKYRGKYVHGWDKLREERYQRMIEMGIINKEWKISKKHDNVPLWDSLPEEEKNIWEHRMAVYAAMIDRMDQGIGKVMQKLKDIGEDDNTLVVFISDNGGCHEQPQDGKAYVKKDGEIGTRNSFQGYGYPWANVSNVPFRWFKHWVHEGGISTPMIAWYPKMIKPNTKSKEIGHIIDLMATFVDLSASTYPEKYNKNIITPMEGKSLRPIFNGELWDEERVLFWEHEGNRSVRKGKWKLVSRFEKGGFTPWQLYNMEKDRSELNDLTKKHPEIVKELVSLYNGWTERTHVVPRDEVLEHKRKLN